MGAQNTSSLSLGSFHKYPYPLPLPQWNNDLYNLHNLKFSPKSYVNVNSLTPSRKLEQRKGIIPVGGDEKGEAGMGEWLQIAINPCTSYGAATLPNTLSFESIQPLCEKGITILI